MRKHWHNASERNPHREAHLLYFANGQPGTPGSSGTPDSSPDPTANTVAYAGQGLTPDGQPIPREGQSAAERPSVGDVVAGGRGSTREEIEDALNADENAGGDADTEKQKKKLKPAEVAAGFETMVKHLDLIRTYRKDKRMTEWMKNNLSAKDQEAAFEALHLVESQHGVAAELHHTSANLAEWKEGKLAPKDFRTSLENGFSEHPRLKQILSSFDAAADSPALADIVNQWNTEGNVPQESDKQLVVQSIWDAIDGDALVAEMQEYLEKWAGHVAKVEEHIRPERPRGPDDARPGMSLMERITDIRRNGIAGIGFYSPLEWYEATKKIYEAFKNARQENLDLMSNKLAVNITGALQELKVPYGEAVNRRFGSTAEADFNKKKGEYMDELKDDSFTVLVNKFHSVRSDPPRAYAVLEAAADHGWLYDIADLGEDTWPVYIFGENFSSVTPSHWNEAQIKNSLGTLRRKNAAGGNDERKKGHERIVSQTDPNVYINRFDAAIKDHNYWQAMGIVDALIDRGKMPEVSEYFTAKMIHHFREYPDAKKYMPRPVLEQFGNTKWNEATTWAQNMVTMNLGSIEELRKDPTAMKGPLLGTIDKLEREIREAAAGSITDPEEIVRITGKVMSGQTVKINDKTISIYTEKYRDYWDETKNNVFGTYKPEQFIGKISTDYYTDASILQLPSGTIQALFDTGSTGQFSTSNLPLLQNYIGFSLKHLEVLRKSDNPEAAAVFHQHIASKIYDALDKAFTNRAADHLHKYQWKMGNNIGGPIIASLIEAELISEEDVFKFVERLPGADEFKESIRDQRRSIQQKGLLHLVSQAPAAPAGGPPGA